MQNAINQLQRILDTYSHLLIKISEEEFSAKPLPHKWSKKELLGHLVDSAQNNIRRFVVAQYEENPAIKYEQDNWVTIANYQHYNTHDLVALWTLLNKHICIVLKNMPVSLTERLCNTGELHTLQWLATDYNKHLLHHLHQILNLEQISYP